MASLRKLSQQNLSSLVSQFGGRQSRRRRFSNLKLSQQNHSRIFFWDIWIPMDSGKNGVLAQCVPLSMDFLFCCAHYSAKWNLSNLVEVIVPNWSRLLLLPPSPKGPFMASKKEEKKSSIEQPNGISSDTDSAPCALSFFPFLACLISWEQKVKSWVSITKGKSYQSNWLLDWLEFWRENC